MWLHQCYRSLDINKESNSHCCSLQLRGRNPSEHILIPIQQINSGSISVRNLCNSVQRAVSYLHVKLFTLICKALSNHWALVRNPLRAGCLHQAVDGWSLLFRKWIKSMAARSITANPSCFCCIIKTNNCNKEGWETCVILVTTTAACRLCSWGKYRPRPLRQDIS